MKHLIFFLIITFLFISCGGKIITLKEPIKVFIEDDIPKIGIEIWNKEIIWVNKHDSPDVMVVKTNKLPNKRWMAMERHRTRFGKLKKPCYLYIKVINNIVIAHEFGHLLGKRDSCENLRSIMCASYKNVKMPLNWFDEFKD